MAVDERSHDRWAVSQQVAMEVQERLQHYDSNSAHYIPKKNDSLTSRHGYDGVSSRLKGELQQTGTKVVNYINILYHIFTV